MYIGVMAVGGHKLWGGGWKAGCGIRWFRGMGERWKIDGRRRGGCGPGMPGPYGGRRGKRVLVERFAGGVNFPTTTKEAVAQGKNPSAAASLRLNASRSTKTLAIDPLLSKKQITQTGPSE